MGAMTLPTSDIAGSITVDTPLGPVTAISSADGLVWLGFDGDPSDLASGGMPRREDRAQEILRRTRDELGRYFSGTLHTFTVPVCPTGSPFQLSVWQMLCEIPYGEVISYGEIASRLEPPGVARAVGRANGENPIAIIVPCHRVVGADGSLTGYAGGIERKRWLLEHEARHAPPEARRRWHQQPSLFT